MVGTLGKDDFEIYDNGVQQEIAVFEHQTEQPLSVALLVDTSGSTAKELKYEVRFRRRASCTRCSREGNPEDAVALYTFNWEIREQQPLHARPARPSMPALKLMHGEAGTALYDAIYLAARELEPREGRKVIVVVTDGGDTVSKMTVHKALEAAQLADAVIYPIVVVPITNDAGATSAASMRSTSWPRAPAAAPSCRPLGAELDKAFTRHYHGTAHAIPAGVLSAECAADQEAVSTRWRCA